MVPYRTHSTLLSTDVQAQGSTSTEDRLALSKLQLIRRIAPSVISDAQIAKLGAQWIRFSGDLAIQAGPFLVGGGVGAWQSRFEVIES